MLTQGTDTLEESAFLVDTIWSRDAPFVLTGAMRNPTLAGADGPANVVAAIQVACATLSRGRGALVVFNDEVHAARHVRKVHSTSPAAFASPDLGPIGHLVEGSVRFLASGSHRRRLAVVDGERLERTRIALYIATLDDDDAMLDSVADAYQGLVVAGFGVTSRCARATLGTLAASMPVVLTSRTGAGSVLTNTYGAVGSERDLLARGLLNGGSLHPYKARVLLQGLLVASIAEIVGRGARLRLAGVVRAPVEQRLRRIPRGAVTSVLSSARDRRQRLEHDPVGQGGSDVGVVVRRSHLDDVHADDRQARGHESAYGIEQAPRETSPGSGVPVPGAWPGSQTSMSTERNTPSQSSIEMKNASVVCP